MYNDMTRRLAAILSADVEGYSRLMQLDELATIRTLTAYQEIVGDLIVHYNGRIVDSSGDNLLAEFPSVAEAVESAVAIQQKLTDRNRSLPDERKMKFRMGIHLGDVLYEGKRIYGNAVNVAARLEGISEPGGLCISAPAYEQVREQLPLNARLLGRKRLKNIVRPVTAYQVFLDPETSADPQGIRTSPLLQQGLERLAHWLFGRGTARGARPGVGRPVHDALHG